MIEIQPVGTSTCGRHPQFQFPEGPNKSLPTAFESEHPTICFFACPPALGWIFWALANVFAIACVMIIASFHTELNLK